MREHVSVGHGILVSAELPVEAEWVLHHHERFDGTGYPAGLRGAEIPLESRIIAVADAFEAMTGERPYQEQLTNTEALAELSRHLGTQFDAACVAALARGGRHDDRRARRGAGRSRQDRDRRGVTPST